MLRPLDAPGGHEDRLGAKVTIVPWDGGLPALLTAEEVARILRVSKATVFRWAAKGILPAARIGRTVRFCQEDVEHRLRRAEGPSGLRPRKGKRGTAAVFPSGWRP